MVKQVSILNRFLTGSKSVSSSSSSSSSSSRQPPQNNNNNNKLINNYNYTDDYENITIGNHLLDEHEHPETVSLLATDTQNNNHNNNNYKPNSYSTRDTPASFLETHPSDFHTNGAIAIATHPHTQLHSQLKHQHPHIDTPSIVPNKSSPTPPISCYKDDDQDTPHIHTTVPSIHDQNTIVDQRNNDLIDNNIKNNNNNNNNIYNTDLEYYKNQDYFKTMSVSNNTTDNCNNNNNDNNSNIENNSSSNNSLHSIISNNIISSDTLPSPSTHLLKHNNIPYHRLSNSTDILMQEKSFEQKEDGFLQRIKKILVAGTGFLCDAYDLFVINNVIVILQLLYPEHKGSTSIVSTAALWGAVAGQLLFGFFADRVGRRIGFIITLSFITLGALGSTLSFNITSGFNIFVMLAIWRTILGFGVGGEYPLSATISSESASTDAKRGRQVASVFSMQGVGIILSPVIILILLQICGPNHLDIVWRVALAFGGIPGLIMIYFRIRMKETAAFEKRKNTISKREIARYIVKNHWRTLLGTAGNWFIFDIVFYANGLFSSTIVLVLNFDSPNSDFDKLMNTVLTALYLALLGLPGYFVGIALIDRIGRRNLQLIGFGLLGITYIIMGATLDHIVKIKALFIILYGLTFFFSNAGPNTTTYVLPSESFPTRIRATCHGISAACGKLGAVLGGYAIQPFYKSNGLGHTLLVCGGISFAGLILTFFFTKETMGRPPIEDDIELSESGEPGEPDKSDVDSNEI